MIGQNNLIKHLDWMINSNCFPRFCILVGERGSGKKMLAKHLRTRFKEYAFAEVGISVDAVREVITNSYRVTTPTIYLFADADSMSVQAKNALLKVTEEPPNKAYFIMTLEDANNTLDTIRSRATIFQLDRYTPKEIIEYAQLTYKDNIELYSDLCSTPGEVDLLYKMGAEDFYAYVEKVVDNIATVNGANVFKIADKVAMKEDAEGYDLKLFWKAFITVCSKRVKPGALNAGDIRYMIGVQVTSEALKKLGIRGVNRQALFDTWVLDIRKEWM